jgi:hypothetical protein
MPADMKLRTTKPEEKPCTLPDGHGPERKKQVD